MHHGLPSEWPLVLLDVPFSPVHPSATLLSLPLCLRKWLDIGVFGISSCPDPIHRLIDIDLAGLTVNLPEW